MMEYVEIRVTGRVQGVGFRHFTQKTAAALGVFGWVKNVSDGSVLLRAAAATDVLARFRESLKKGPPFSRVDQLVETPLESHDMPYRGFTITY